MASTDFGLLGLKIGDKIVCTYNHQTYIVGSGNGAPSNGGSLLRNPNMDEGGLVSIRLLTRRILGKNFNDDLDILKFYNFEGRSLREIYKSKVEYYNDL